ncbi:MAG: DUF305 domain-containing protein [Acidimicrobiales bacterium]
MTEPKDAPVGPPVVGTTADPDAAGQADPVGGEVDPARPADPVDGDPEAAIPLDPEAARQVEHDAAGRSGPDAASQAGAADAAGVGGRGGLSWPQVAVLGLALAFLGLAIGLLLSRDRPPGEDSVDVGFFQDMISHHEQGLEIATYTLANAEDATVRSFADEVHVFQSYEMGLMERSLQDWGHSRANRPDTAMEWMGMPFPVDEMPGMATPAQMDELRDARGAEADAQFLELMAAHHAGGLHMAQYAALNAGDDDVQELAERMVYNQSIEINEYARTAERLGLPVEIERVPVPAEPAS